MRVIPDSGTLLMRGRAHWIRCGFAGTTLIDDVVMLATLGGQDATLGHDEPVADAFAGLAFDRHCRLFHPVPEEGRIEYLFWGRETALNVHIDAADPYEISGAESETMGLASTSPLPRQPLALACDDSDYLYIADPGNGTDAPSLWLIDIWQHEVARRLELPARPLDVTCVNGKVYALLDATGDKPQGWLALGPCDAPQNLPWRDGLTGASRLDVIARDADRPRGFVLTGAGTKAARVVCIDDPAQSVSIEFCTDFLIGTEDPELGWLFVFARRKGEDFLQRRLKGHAFELNSALQAPNYDGRGIARTPDGRIAYWTERGLRHAAPARNRYELNGNVYGFALDSNREQNEWGRLTLEACIPEGTRVTVRCFTRDDFDNGDPLPRTQPVGTPPWTIAQPEATPLPSMTALAQQPRDAQPLFRDDSPVPLAPPPFDGFKDYEAPVIAPPGRFLWLVFVLAGTRSKTPKLRSARVEFPDHNLVRQLPKTLWRDPRANAFLRRYLMPLAATLDEWGSVAAARHRLLDPRVTPVEALEWLGSLVGLAMDPCWPERARREMLRSAVRLFRIRGTLAGLSAMIEILTGAQVLIVEKFRLRSGGVVGNPDATLSRSVLGSGFRVGGSIGTHANVTLTAPTQQAFDDFAHRFSVMIVAQLADEQMACVRRLIETHKPAHTMFDLCAVETGTRVGVGLHVGLASVIGRASGFSPLTLGDAVLGKGYVLGRPELDRPAPTATQDLPHSCAAGVAP